MPHDLPYFAYGSNVDPARFTTRCPDHVELGTAWLPGWRVAIAGASRMWGAGVGTLRRRPGALVPGVLYQLSPEHWQTLDRIEGHPGFYRRVRIALGQQRAWTYLLPDHTPENPPTTDYHDAVVTARSARRWDPGPWHLAVKHADLHTDARK